MTEFVSDEGAPTRPVLTCTAVALPRCPRCHAMHPLAVDFNLDPTKCHECGGPAATPGEPQTELAYLGGVHGWVANFFLGIGDMFAALARRLEK